MQVGIDVKHIHTDFGGRSFFGFGDVATFQNLVVFESTDISENEEVTPTKIGVHVCYINTYLHEFFEPIPID